LIATSPEALQQCSHLILPGVGAYTAAMNNLDQRGLSGAIKSECEAGKPFLGICLGMQLLSSVGFEPDECNGLNLIPGRTVRMPETEKCILPHVGWNNLKTRKKHPVFQGVKADVDFYFVHSFCVELENSENLISSCCYSKDFSAAIGHGNILGLQFHPEKSQSSGLKILNNFCEWDGQC